MAIGKKALLGMAVAGIVGSGARQGIQATGAHDAFYEAVLGDAKADEYTMGTKVPIMGGLFALPRPSSRVMGVGGAVGGAGIGAIAGRGSLRGRAIGAGIGAVAGGIAGAGSTAGHNRNLRYLNQTTASDFGRIPTNERNTMPSINGNIVMGMYNSRMA